jgi:hypothetical protein
MRLKAATVTRHLPSCSVTCTAVLLTEEAMLPSDLIALLVELSKVPDQLKVGDQAMAMHFVNLVLGFVEQIGDVLVASRIQDHGIGLSTTDNHSMDSHLFGNRCTDIWKVMTPVNSGDHACFAGNLFVKRSDGIAMRSHTSKVHS